MSLYPVTKQMIWQMIENERRLGEPFTLALVTKEGHLVIASTLMT